MESAVPYANMLIMNFIYISVGVQVIMTLNARHWNILPGKTDYSGPPLPGCQPGSSGKDPFRLHSAHM
jgi:hypothetical protein